MAPKGVRLTDCVLAQATGRAVHRADQKTSPIRTNTISEGLAIVVRKRQAARQGCFDNPALRSFADPIDSKGRPERGNSVRTWAVTAEAGNPMR